jgi:hypothetical protein
MYTWGMISRHKPGHPFAAAPLTNFLAACCCRLRCGTYSSGGMVNPARPLPLTTLQYPSPRLLPPIHDAGTCTTSSQCPAPHPTSAIQSCKTAGRHDTTHWPTHLHVPSHPQQQAQVDTHGAHVGARLTADPVDGKVPADGKGMLVKALPCGEQTKAGCKDMHT